MAQQDAMEQVKEVLRQVIRYRFWISVSIAAVFAVVAYVLGSGPVRALAVTETNKIKGAETNVKKYASTTVPTDQYKPIVQEKTEVLTKDVNTAWKELFDRQAPLLTWPETVQERFRKWGRKWPETEDPGKVNLAIVDYIYAYPAYVDEVYKTFHPFNYETGEGIVAAAPKEGLLRPSTFQIEHLPDMGKVWAAQERLWVQHTMLDVVAKVNKSAKDWDSAIIKQIESLEVGNPIAQDQRSLAKGEQLTEAPAILAPGQEEAAAAGAAEAGEGGAGMGGMMAQMMGGRKGREGMMGGMMPGMMGGMGSGGATGAGSQYDQTIYYITPQNDKGQYKILPVTMTVLIDQDRVQDFLVELENSPMSIQVMDFELQRPSARVNKPEKGTQAYGGMGGEMMGGMMGQMMMMRSMDRMGGGYGGMMSQMGAQMRMMRNQGGMEGMMGGMPGMMGMPGMGGLASQAQRKGTDIRNIKREEERKKKVEQAEKSKGPSLFDPYFDIVEVTVYGQARFFNPPPTEPAVEPSPGEIPPAAGGTPAAAGSTAPAAQPAPGPDAPAAATAPEEKPEATKPAGGEDAKPAEAAKPATKPAEAQSKPDPAGKTDATQGEAKKAVPK